MKIALGREGKEAATTEKCHRIVGNGGKRAVVGWPDDTFHIHSAEA